jgi:FMN-dependent NADH-azoreductase
MKTLLHIDSGLFSDASQSNQLSQTFVAEFQQANPETRVIRRDLAASALPHLDAGIVSAFMTPAADRDAGQQEAAARSDQAIAELQQADVLVIGLPMYNFSLPSTLKAWIDHVARAGITFRYTDSGPEGLLQGKQAFILAARGGLYRDNGNDHQIPYIKQILAFMGITDVTVIDAEGLNLGEEPKQQALNGARAAFKDAVVSAGHRMAA